MTGVCLKCIGVANLPIATCCGSGVAALAAGVVKPPMASTTDLAHRAMTMLALDRQWPVWCYGAAHSTP